MALDEDDEATEGAIQSLTDEPEEIQLRAEEPDPGLTWSATGEESVSEEPIGVATNCTFGGPSGCGTRGGYCCAGLICCGPTQGCCMGAQGPYCSWAPCP